MKNLSNMTEADMEKLENLKQLCNKYTHEQMRQYITAMYIIASLPLVFLFFVSAIFVFTQSPLWLIGVFLSFGVVFYAGLIIGRMLNAVDVIDSKLRWFSDSETRHPKNE